MLCAADSLVSLSKTGLFRIACFIKARCWPNRITAAVCAVLFSDVLCLPSKLEVVVLMRPACKLASFIFQDFQEFDIPRFILLRSTNLETYFTNHDILKYGTDSTLEFLLILTSSNDGKS